MVVDESSSNLCLLLSLKDLVILRISSLFWVPIISLWIVLKEWASSFEVLFFKKQKILEKTIEVLRFLSFHKVIQVPHSFQRECNLNTLYHFPTQFCFFQVSNLISIINRGTRFNSFVSYFLELKILRFGEIVVKF